MDLQLKEKIALVTGANRGTGEIIARTLATEGVTVVVHANEEGASTAVAETIDSAVAVWGNLADDSGAMQVYEQTLAAVGTLDILINNYGTAAAGTWQACSTDQWLDMYQRNLLSATRLIQHFMPDMKAKGWGRIIQLGTIGSHQPNSIMPHYYAAKGALATMSVSLTKELANSGITVNTVSPGMIHTEEVETAYRQRAKKKGWGDDWNSIEKAVVKHDYPNPAGRLAKREEIADLVTFLASPRAAYINGQNIRIDGGAVQYV